MRTLFLGSPPFATAVLRQLLASQHEVVGVVTPKSRTQRRGLKHEHGPVADLALKHGLPLLQPKGLKTQEALDQLSVLNPEVLVVASYGEILNQEVLSLAPHGALNVHGSCLPRWRGAAPVQAAILAGDEETGVSVQRMVLALDEGDVMLEKRTSLGSQETAGELLERLAELGGKALVEAVDQLAEGSAVFTAQDPSKATMTRKIKKHDGLIDWSLEGLALTRHVRAMSPWPGAITRLPDGRSLTVLALEVTSADDALPGTFLGGPEFLVACGDGTVNLLQVKPAGKGAMTGRAFLRGARLLAKSRLGQELDQ